MHDQQRAVWRLTGLRRRTRQPDGPALVRWNLAEVNGCLKIGLGLSSINSILSRRGGAIFADTCDVLNPDFAVHKVPW